MHNRNRCLYNEKHLWCLNRDNDRAIIGISNYALQLLGKIYRVTLPAAGSRVARGKAFGTLVATGAVCELVCPVDGCVINSNNYLDGNPAAVNADPYGEGWMLHVQLEAAEQLCELMGSGQYWRYIAEREPLEARFASA